MNRRARAPQRPTPDDSAEAADEAARRLHQGEVQLPEVCGGGRADRLRGGLGWRTAGRRRRDEASNAFYYHNAGTGETSVGDAGNAAQEQKAQPAAPSRRGAIVLEKKSGGKDGGEDEAAPEVGQALPVAAGARRRRSSEHKSADAMRKGDEPLGVQRARGATVFLKEVTKKAEYRFGASSERGAQAARRHEGGGRRVAGALKPVVDADSRLLSTEDDDEEARARDDRRDDVNRGEEEAERVEGVSAARAARAPTRSGAPLSTIVCFEEALAGTKGAGAACAEAVARVALQDLDGERPRAPCRALAASAARSETPPSSASTATARTISTRRDSRLARAVRTRRTARRRRRGRRARRRRAASLAANKMTDEAEQRGGVGARDRSRAAEHRLEYSHNRDHLSRTHCELWFSRSRQADDPRAARRRADQA